VTEASWFINADSLEAVFNTLRNCGALAE